jgi:hypothetical protein
MVIFPSHIEYVKSGTPVLGKLDAPAGYPIGHFWFGQTCKVPHGPGHMVIDNFGSKFKILG